MTKPEFTVDEKLRRFDDLQKLAIFIHGKLIDDAGRFCAPEGKEFATLMGHWVSDCLCVLLGDRCGWEDA